MRGGEGVSDNVDEVFKGSYRFFKAYLVVFGLFLPKPEEFLKIRMWKGLGEGALPMWIINKFYNNIIKSAKVDKGRVAGSKALYKMWTKKAGFCLTLPVALQRKIY